MNTRKLTIIVAAILINCVAVVCFNASTSAAVANAGPLPAHASQIATLPTITVHPSAAQLRALRHVDLRPAS